MPLLEDRALLSWFHLLFALASPSGQDCGWYKLDYLCWPPREMLNPISV